MTLTELKELEKKANEPCSGGGDTCPGCEAETALLKQFPALIARLESAEEALEAYTSCDYCGIFNGVSVETDLCCCGTARAHFEKVKGGVMEKQLKPRLARAEEMFLLVQEFKSENELENAADVYDEECADTELVYQLLLILEDK